MIEPEYWVRRQMGAICLLGELSIHPTQFIAGIIYSSDNILRDMCRWGEFGHQGVVYRLISFYRKSLIIYGLTN